MSRTSGLVSSTPTSPVSWGATEKDRKPELFQVYLSGDRSKLLSSMEWCIDLWVQDAIDKTSQVRGRNVRDDLKQVAAMEILKSLQDAKIKSGDHLVNYCRLAVRRVLLEAAWDSVGAVRPARQTVRRRLQEKKPAYEPGECYRRVPMQGDRSHLGRAAGRRQPHVDPRFFASDESVALRKREFQESIEEACWADPDPAVGAIAAVILCFNVSVDDAARFCDVPTSTARGKFDRLFVRIGRHSDENQDDLGIEVLGSAWKEARTRGLAQEAAEAAKKASRVGKRKHRKKPAPTAAKMSQMKQGIKGESSGASLPKGASEPAFQNPRAAAAPMAGTSWEMERASGALRGPQAIKI